MELGTIDPIIEKKPATRLASRRTIGGGSGKRNGGGGGGGNDGGDNNPGGRNFADAGERPVPDKARVLTWFLLIVVLMTFGGLVGAYIVIATNKAVEWRPFDLPIQLWISTVLIIVSSLSYHAAKISFDKERQHEARKWLIWTTILGATFISSQLLAWLALANRGLYMAGNPYAGFFYLLTALHAVHVLGGIIALGCLLLRSWNDTMHGPEMTYRQNIARAVGWYWHFMGALWLALFGLLGFWK